MASTSNNNAAASSRPILLPEIAELHNPNFLDILLPASVQSAQNAMQVDREPAPTSQNPMMTALKATFNQTFTANLAPAYSSTLSPTLDAFTGLAPYTFGAQVGKYLDSAWKEDSNLTLRLIWNLRSIPDGKGDKELFYRAFGWLYDNHPRTAISNLHLLVEPVSVVPKKKNAVMPHGYWKDLLNILALATVDELSNIHGASKFLHCPRTPFTYGKSKKRNTIGTPASRIEASLQESQQAKVEAEARRKAKAVENQRRLEKKLSEPKFRALYVTVARLFAEQLIKDVQILTDVDSLGPGEDRIAFLKRISLAGKWAPTPGGSHDRVTNIATAISELIYQAQVFTPYPSALKKPISPQERAAVLRSFYQRWILTELRRTLSCPEPLMSAKRWSEIIYTRVPSISMKNNTSHFFKHDQQRFEEYLTSVEDRKKSISGATLLPHELVSQVYTLGSTASGHIRDSKKKGSKEMQEFEQKLAKAQLRVVEAQWKTLIESLRASGSIENAIAVCDVSGSMGRLSEKYNKRHVNPILPAVSLSLVLASLAKPSFNGGFITFSARPSFHQLDLNKSLFDLVSEMGGAEWSMNTDLHAVFVKLLLPLAVKNKIKQEDMIKRLFIFSDMQFDACSNKGSTAAWETNYDAIEKAYKKAGYEIPQIVYWDLSTGEWERTVEVQSDRKGVAMMNGFSPAMLKVFMGEEEEPTEWENVNEEGESVTVVEKAEDAFNPLNVMKKALMKQSFDGLVVLD